MLVSVIIMALLLFVALNTRVEGNKLPLWVLICIILLTLASWQSAVVMLGIATWTIYKGVKSGKLDTIDFIENLIN